MNTRSGAPRGPLHTTYTEDASSSSWSELISTSIANRWQFASLHAGADIHNPTLSAIFVRAGDQKVIQGRMEKTQAPSIIDLVPAAQWDEREARDLYGWRFEKHLLTAPFVDHPMDSTAWTTPVFGDDTHQVPVGPVHAGIIESGHFRFHAVGDRVLHLDLQLFYKHRGLEAAAEGGGLDDGLQYIQRACASGSVSNGIAYAQACESILGIVPNEDLRRERTLLIELERVYNHLNDITAIYAGVGFSPGNMLFAALKERAQRLNAKFSGHRFLFHTVAIAGSGVRLEHSVIRAMREELASIAAEFAQAWREVQFAGSAQERMDDVGVVKRNVATLLGAVGPAARASGMAVDAREHSPRLWYPDFRAARPHETNGDVASRLDMRGVELAQSFTILDELLSEAFNPGASEEVQSQSNVGVGVVEGPRGRTICAVEAEGAKVKRVHLRTASYANWPLMAIAARDSLLADFPLINKSFELCYACVDR